MGTANRKPADSSARRLRDAAVMEHVRQVHADNYGVYGVRKMRRALRRDGIAIGREQTAWLMRLANFVRQGQRSRPCHHRHTEEP